MSKTVLVAATSTEDIKGISAAAAADVLGNVTAHFLVGGMSAMVESINQQHLALGGQKVVFDLGYSSDSLVFSGADTEQIKKTTNEEAASVFNNCNARIFLRH